MGFVSLVNPIRDLTPWKKILDYAVNSNVVACFVGDALGKIVLFEESVIHLTRLPARTLSRMPVRDLWAYLRKGAPLLHKGVDQVEDLYARTDFRGPGDKGYLTWWGFPLGTLAQPSGIYFLRYFDRMPPENQISGVEYPSILQMRDKLLVPVARHLLDDADQRILNEEIQQLMTWEDRGFKKNRVLLVDGVTLDDGAKPIYLQYEGIEDRIRMVQENISMGDQQFFKKIADGGGRLALVEHTERSFRYEIMLPLTWYVHVMGWVGIPIQSLDVWMKPIRRNFEEIARNIGDALGEERKALGLLPRYDVHRGLFELESLMGLMESMIARHPPRPFVLALIRADPDYLTAIQAVIDRSKRPSDILSQVDEGLVLLFPDQDVSRAKQVEKRYLGLLGKLVASDPRLGSSLSVYWFPSAAWTASDLLATLVSRPATECRPVSGAPAEEKQQFEDWFKRFIVLKDWE